MHSASLSTLQKWVSLLTCIIYRCVNNSQFEDFDNAKKADEDEKKLDFSPWDANSLQIIHGRSGTIRTGLIF